MTIYILISLFFCHFLADYVFVDDTMLSAKRFGTPLYPIWMHATLHGVLMWFVLIFFGINPWNAFLFYLFEKITHFLIDVLKGKINKWYPPAQSPVNKIHWVIFGLDQFLHALVILLGIKLFI